ncbi:MAG: hypothetical protein AAF702_25005 [Chloroflexota bacterium]
MEQTLEQTLSQILWIGGAPDAGKTTIAANLAAKYDLLHYEFDHRAVGSDQLDRAKAPRAFEWFERSPDELWQQRNPEKIAAHTLETYVQIFPTQLQDLLEVANNSKVIAEGCLFLPELVAPLLSAVSQAIWIFPTEDFKRQSFEERGKNKYSTRDDNSDPALATHNFFTRDFILANHMRTEAEARQLKQLEIDGSLSPDEFVTIVERHFAPHLTTIF